MGNTLNFDSDKEGCHQNGGLPLYFMCCFTLFLDVNECANDTLNVCDVNSFCTDTIGSFFCTCDSGFNETAINGVCIGKLSRSLLISETNN